MEDKLKELISFIESRERVIREKNYPHHIAFMDIVSVKNRIKKEL